MLDILLGGWGRAIVVITRLKNRPGGDLRAAAKQYDQRVEAASKGLAKAKRKYGAYDQRTAEARAALEAATADTGAVDSAWVASGGESDD
jgi:hypothetical protein